MKTLKIEIPESVLLGSGQSSKDFVKEATFLLMAKLFELGRLSSGKAAEACGMTRVDFLLAAGRAGIPVVQLDKEELERELESAR